MIIVTRKLRLPDGSTIKIRARVAIEIEYPEEAAYLTDELSEKIREAEQSIAKSVTEVMEADMTSLDLDVWSEAINDAFGYEPEEGEDEGGE
jgi:urease gamma subunit